MLPIMTTAKIKFVAFRRKFDFWERREKTAFFHKVLSHALARYQKVGTVVLANIYYV
jgi:hypothetical protein